MRVEKFDTGEIKVHLGSGFAAHIMPEVGAIGFTNHNIVDGHDLSIDDFKAIYKIIIDNDL